MSGRFKQGKAALGLMIGLVLSLGVCAGVAQAQSTYSYTGAPYASFTNFTTCQAGDCEDFSAGQAASMSFQTASPLSPGLSSANVASLVTAFNASDGLTTYISGDAQAYIFSLTASTDVNGAITSASAVVVRHQTTTLAAAVGAAPFPDPNTKFDSIVVATAGTSFARHNGTCGTIGVSPAGRPDSCQQFKTVDPGLSVASASAPVQWVSPPPVVVAAVPTLSEWTMILLSLMLVGYAITRVQRRI